MRVLWTKVWYDLWHYKVRTLLAVLSIAAGVFAVGVVFGMTDQLLSGMDAAHQAVTPSHLNMQLTRYATREQIEGIKNVEGVLDVEPYNLITLNYRFDPQAEWKQGTIVLRENWTQQRMDMTQLKQGAWPRKDNVAIERLSSSYYGADIGDTVWFKQGDRIREFTVAGKVRHPFVPPPQFGGQAYLFMSREGMERFGVPKGKFSFVYVRVTPYSDAYAREVATDIKDRLATQGIGVEATFYQNPTKHWGRMYIEGINFVMQVLAVVSLLLSVVLVYNTLTALVTQQTNQIGILKAIGGRAGTILQVYLTGVLVYGLLALLIALPLGVYLAWAITGSFLNLFNIDYTEFRISTSALLLQIAAATLVPLVAGFLPVLNGARLTVREAIASYGLGGDFGSNRFDRFVERVGARLLPTQYATALGNMFRHKGRLLLTQVVLVSAGAMFLIVMTLASSMNYTLDTYFASHHYDLTVYLSGLTRASRALDLAYSAKGVTRAEVQLSLPATIRKEGQRVQDAGWGASAVGIDPASNFFSERIVQGRWLLPDDTERVAVLNYDTAKKNNIRVGEMLTLDLGPFGKREWRVVGLYQLIFNNGGFAADSIYVPLNALADATKQYDRATMLYVQTAAHDETYVEGVRTQLKALSNERNINLFYLLTEIELRDTGEGQFNIVVSMLLSLAVIVAMVGGIGLMGALSISVVERTKEIGVLRAIGARTRTILGMFVMEGILQGVLSWCISVLLALLLSEPMSDILGRMIFNMPLDFLYNYGAMATWLGVVLVISIFASILPARNATRVSVRDSLAYA
ncbi:MAG: FtsX-like permease family protein [Chloroflexi bacterium]|nr:FtsX-like permease family protein [Chloroflexota bacterium]